MRSTLRNSGIFLSCALLALMGACGGGGSSTPNGNLTKTDPPVATAPACVAGTSLTEYQTYTFTTSATDPDIGVNVASCTWNFGDGSNPVTVATAPFSATHIFLSASPSGGQFTVTVTPTVVSGSTNLNGTAAATNVTVAAAANPFTLTAIQPASAATIPVGLGSTANETFTFSVKYAGTGTVDVAKLSTAVFAPGASQATGTAAITPPATGALDGTGVWTAVMAYPAPASLGGTYTANPTFTIGDSYGVLAVPLAFPAQTFQAVVASATPPSIAVSSPKATTTYLYALQLATIQFTVTDAGTFPTTVTVNWGDGSSPNVFTLSGATLATGMAPPSPQTHQYVTAGSYVVTLSAVDTQQSNNTATPQTLNYSIQTNALPTATISTPQASGTLPLYSAVQAFTPTALASEMTTLPATGNYPLAVVIPMGGQLNFSGAITQPGSNDGVSPIWTFPGGNPGTATTLTVNNVSFAGVPGQIVAYLVEFQAIDSYNRLSDQVGQGLPPQPSAMAVNGQDTAPYRIWVIVDGINTKQFTLNLMFRQLTDNNGPATLTPVVTTANGLGATMMIFQDGLSTAYAVSSANAGTITVPVRGNLPFYMNLPTFNGTDPLSYMLRIPNVTGQDPTLEAAMPQGSSSFAFVNGNPTLNLVTSQGFAPETDLTAGRKINALVSGAETIQAGFSPVAMVLGTTPGNDRWFDRLSVPKTDPNAIPSFFETNASPLGLFEGIPAYQSFAEWPIYLMSVESDFMPYTQYGGKSSNSPTASAGTSTQVGFNLSYPTYGTATATNSDNWGIVAMQAFRVPANSQDPYTLSPASPDWNLDSCVSLLNPQTMGSGPATFFDHMVYNNTTDYSYNASTQTTTAGGLQGFVVPYNVNDVNRAPNAPAIRNLTQIAAVFAYAEYLWSSVWVRPLVLNNAELYSPDAADTFAPPPPPPLVAPPGIANYPYFRNSNPAAWPKYTTTPSLILPDHSTFDLTANGGPAFTGGSPVATGNTTPSSTGVGRFYWTAFTPNYNSANGALVSRTWLADATGLPPQAVPQLKAGDAVTAMGLIPPQDTSVDKRGRDANGVLTGAPLGGYRIMWFNPNVDINGNVVPPDFWVVEIAGSNTSNEATTHFMLPANYPVASGGSDPLAGQATTDSILTDAREFLPSGTHPGGTAAPTDTVAPGYCWFDVPPELRPSTGSGSATVTVFALKSIKNNNAIAAARPLNRTDWIDAIKTATSTMALTASSGRDVSYVHKIPFNFGWDIVVVNGEATIVAP